MRIPVPPVRGRAWNPPQTGTHWNVPSCSGRCEWNVPTNGRTIGAALDGLSNRARREEAAMETIRLTTAGAIVRYLIAQRIELDGNEVPLFPGVFAIFGHGNVTCLGEALEAVQDRLPTWRGQNEQTMAMAAVAFAKAKRRRQIMVATSSIGPGALNMVTAAGIAHANRLPLLLLSGDTFASRVPDPVLQQVEHVRRPERHGERRLPAGDPVLGPRSRTRRSSSSRCPRPSRRCSIPRIAGRPSSGCRKTSRRRPSTSRRRSSSRRVHRIRRPGPDPDELDAAARVLREARASAPDRRRRRALLPRHGAARGVRGATRRAGRGDGRRQVVAPAGTTRCSPARSA